jgi:hypothetical protein
MKSFRSKWTDADLELLRRLYPGTSTAKIAILLGRTEAACSAMASILNLKKDESQQKPMTREERDEWMSRLHLDRGGFPDVSASWAAAMKGRVYDDMNLKVSPVTSTRIIRISTGGPNGGSSLNSSHSIARTR